MVDARGAIAERLQVPTPSHSPQAVEDAIVDLVTELRSRHAGVESVGIGAAGWVDNTQSIVRFSPHLAWREEPLKDRLHERIDLPLIVDNDANAAAWSEYRFGAGRGSSVMVCITLGTGIGGGLVINGDLFRGTYGMAGEWGRMISVPGGHRCQCGNRGCWEQYASGNALVREARELARSNSPMAYRLLEMLGGDPDQITGPGVTAAALQGEQTAIELLADVGQWLGQGIANLAAALDPDLVVIGGGVSAAGDLLLQPARQMFARTLTGRGFRQQARLELAHFRNDAGLIGAADLARHAVLDPPMADRGGSGRAAVAGCGSEDGAVSCVGRTLTRKATDQQREAPDEAEDAGPGRPLRERDADGDRQHGRASRTRDRSSRPARARRVAAAGAVGRGRNGRPAAVRCLRSGPGQGGPVVARPEAVASGPRRRSRAPAYDRWSGRPTRDRAGPRSDGNRRPARRTRGPPTPCRRRRS